MADLHKFTFESDGYGKGFRLTLDGEEVLAYGITIETDVDSVTSVEVDIPLAEVARRGNVYAYGQPNQTVQPAVRDEEQTDD